MSDGVVGGRLVDDRFRLLTPLGRGKAGQVWQAVDEQTGRTVAVKLHRGRPGHQPAAGVSHPCVVSIIFSGTHEGAAYTAMEFVDGVSLATVLEEGPVPAHDIDSIALAICDALHAAHAAGVTHGNLKPSNVLIANGGGKRPVVKVGDFAGQGNPGEDMYALGLLMEAMSGRRDPIVERLLSRDPYTPAQLRSILTGTAGPPSDPEEDEPERERLVRAAVISGAVTLAVVIVGCAWFLQPSAPPDFGSGELAGEQPVSAVHSGAERSAVPGVTKAPPAAVPSTSETSGPAVTTGATGATATTGAIEAVKSVIDGQLKAGNIEQGAASMLTSRLDEIARFQSRGQTKQANDRIDMLKNQLEGMRRTGKVTEAGYDAILESLNRLSY